MTWRRLVVVLLGISSIAYCALTAFELYSPGLTPVGVGFQSPVLVTTNSGKADPEVGDTRDPPAPVLG